MTDQEELIRKIMSEVMADLAKDNVSFAKNSAPSRPTNSGGGKVSVADYPLAEQRPDLVISQSGKRFDEITYEDVVSGKLGPNDFRISKETLEMQAQVAEAAGRAPLAGNLRRAAELTAVPDERLLQIYNALRPYRSSKQELLDIANELENQFDAKVAADWVREAADVYEQRGRLRRED